MKNIYLFGGLMIFGTSVFGQEIAPYKSDQSVVHAGYKYSHQIKTVHQDFVDNNNRGGTTYYSEDFESGLTGNNTGTQTATGSWATAIAAGANSQVGWEVTSVGHANDAGSTFNIPALLSTTGVGVSGQWMLLDSDSDGSSGIDEEATLTSPAIDFGSVATSTLALEWQQFFGEWQNDSLFVEVSTDNGATWSGTSVSNGVGRENRPNPEYMRLDLSPYLLAGMTQVKVRFRWVGQWDYGWQVDDVKIVDLPDHNLRIQTAKATHYKVHPLAIQAGFSDKIEYTKIPTSQIFPMSFAGNINNLGAMTQTNVELSVDVNSGTYNGTSATITLANGADSTVETTTTYTPPSTTAAYSVDYSVDYDSVAFEDDPSGLSTSSSFEVTSSEFARDRDNYTGAGLWNGETASVSNAYQMGHLWQMQTTQMLEGISVVLTGSTGAGVIAYASVFEVDTSSGDYTFIQSSADVNVYGYNIASTSGTGSPQLYIPIQQTLTAGRQYIICLGHYGGPDALVIANSTDVSASSYTTFILDGTDNTWYYLTSTPMIRLHFQTPVWVGVDEETSTNGIQLGQNVPNPANGLTTIGYSIENSAKVSLTITDLSGKVVKVINEGEKGAGVYSVNVDVNDMAPGMYNYTLSVNGLQTSKRMVITE